MLINIFKGKKFYNIINLTMQSFFDFFVFHGKFVIIFVFKFPKINFLE